MPVDRPTGNVLAERTIQTLCMKCQWLSDFEDADTGQASSRHWEWRFNEERLHLALGSMTPA